MSFEQTKAQVIDKLRDAGVKKVVIHYDGSGDSGQVDRIDYFDEHAEFTPSKDRHKVISDEKSYDAKTKGWVTKQVERMEDFDTMCDNLATDALSELGVDWYNNEGGYGECTLDVTTGNIEIAHEHRVYSSNHEDFKL